MEPWLTDGPTFTAACTAQMMERVELGLHCESLTHWRLLSADDLESLTGTSRILNLALLRNILEHRQRTKQ